MIHEIFPKDLHSLIEKSPKFIEDNILIDCREEAEWREGHGAPFTFFPLSKFESEAQSSPLFRDKKKSVYIICRSGRRSLNACVYLQNLGFENLYNVEGGTLQWIEDGLPMIQPA